MYNFSEELTRNINSCNLTLKSGLVLNGPKDHKIEISTSTCIVDLLSIEEMKRYKNIGSTSNSFEASVENVVVRDKVKEILGFPGYKIDLENSPAGSITTIAYGIYLKSKLHISEGEYFFNLQYEGITIVEQMSSIISYYMNIPYDKVVSLPINEIYKKYGIVSKSFPSQVMNPFQAEDPE